jgi:hypothetical protein
MIRKELTGDKSPEKPPLKRKAQYGIQGGEKV